MVVTLTIVIIDYHYTFTPNIFLFSIIFISIGYVVLFSFKKPILDIFFSQAVKNVSFFTDLKID